MTRMDTGRTNQTIDQDRRRLLGAATMGMAVAGAASLLPSQLAAAPPGDPAIEARWRARLAPYYAEAGVDPSGIRMGPARAPFDEAMCVVVEEARPAVVSFHFGLPHPGLLARVKAAGALTLSSATTVAEARWLEAHGVDGVIAQGREAGGHRGMFLSDDIDGQPGLISLLPQVRDAVRLPRELYDAWRRGGGWNSAGGKATMRMAAMPCVCKNRWAGRRNVTGL